MNQSFVVEGSRPLSGVICPQGSKNEALQVISAVLLTYEEVIIKNIPDILDVRRHISLLAYLGVQVQQINSSSFRFSAKELSVDNLASDFYKGVAKTRGSFLIMSGLIARLGFAFLPMPGGDKIGRRKLDAHLEGMTALGVEFTYERGGYRASIPNKLKPAQIVLPEASVTGTANVIMLASKIEGVTTIYNAACDPYVQQLCRMLLKMGVHIEGIASNLIRVHGKSEIKGVTHKIMPDMIEIGSWIGLAAMSRSSITLKGVNFNDLGIIPKVFQKMGISLQQKGQDLHIPTHESYEIQDSLDGSMLTISDAPWPGLTPDLISIILVIATQAKGAVLIHQKMFESRLYFADKIIEMGAKIILCDPHRATVIGLDHKIPLRGIEVSSPDIRAGISLLIAALCAKGKSTIHNIEQIDRGYERIDEKLTSLGARIDRVDGY